MTVEELTPKQFENFKNEIRDDWNEFSDFLVEFGKKMEIQNNLTEVK